MAGLADEIRSEPSRRQRKNRIQQVLDSLDAKDRAALLEALNDTNIAGSAISRVLAKRGIKLGESTITKYRSGVYGSV
jgi:hypothetical protein